MQYVVLTLYVMHTLTKAIFYQQKNVTHGLEAFNIIFSSLLWVINNTSPTYPLLDQLASQPHYTESQHIAEQRFNIWYKSTTIQKTSWSLSHWENRDNSTTSRITYDEYQGGLDPFDNPIRDKSPSLLEDVVPRNLTSFFQLDH